MIIPVVLAGGSGTRLWPVSRQDYPKQFVKLLNQTLSLFQTTVLRAIDLCDTDHCEPIVICSETNRFMVAEQLQAIQVDATIILEPVGRNTAAAAALAALSLSNREFDQPMMIMPSDHDIDAVDAFKAAVETAALLAVDGKIVTFGVLPARAETGYGYIQRGQAIATDSGQAFMVSRFVEKPDATTASTYVCSGEHYWNSGMFVMLPSVYLSELQKHAPDIHTAVCAAFDGCTRDLDFVRIPRQAFEAVRSDSLDYAIMEQTDLAAVVPFSAAWNDVGSWLAVSQALPADEQGNTVLGDVVLENCHNCLVRSDSRLVTTIGLSDVIVVETPDAILVADKNQTQVVKSIVNQLRVQGRSEALHHTRVYRPWGWYETVCLCERFQVKRIQVTPGHTLSLQMHFHRAEHWIVVKGTAEITRGDSVILLTEDQSTYIDLGVKHRLANPGKIPLEIIEVQTGSYLGEDDIVRFEDTYGRGSC